MLKNITNIQNISSLVKFSKEEKDVVNNTLDSQTLSGREWDDSNSMETTLAEIQSVTFKKTTLGWTDDNWIFMEGAHPTLKNVGITN